MLIKCFVDCSWNAHSMLSVAFLEYPLECFIFACCLLRAFLNDSRMPSHVFECAVNASSAHPRQPRPASPASSAKRAQPTDLGQVSSARRPVKYCLWSRAGVRCHQLHFRRLWASFWHSFRRLIFDWSLWIPGVARGSPPRMSGRWGGDAGEPRVGDKGGRGASTGNLQPVAPPSSQPRLADHMLYRICSVCVCTTLIMLSLLNLPCLFLYPLNMRPLRGRGRSQKKTS